MTNCQQCRRRLRHWNITGKCLERLTCRLPLQSKPGVRFDLHTGRPATDTANGNLLNDAITRRMQAGWWSYAGERQDAG
jgi:hypothetical protein